MPKKGRFDYISLALKTIYPWVKHRIKLLSLLLRKLQDNLPLLEKIIQCQINIDLDIYKKKTISYHNVERLSQCKVKTDLVSVS